MIFRLRSKRSKTNSAFNTAAKLIPDKNLLIHLTVKYSCTLLVLSLLLGFSSCAIHAKFPYICFYSACVKGQLGIDRLPGLKKQMKAKARMKKRKAMAKNKKKNRVMNDYKGPDSDPRDETYATSGDSTLHRTDSVYSFKHEAKLNLIKIVIEKKPSGKDSLTYFFIEDKNDLSEEDRKNASNYLRLCGIQNISKVTIRDLLDKSERGKHEASILRYKSKNILKFLKKEGIPEDIIYTVD